MIDLTRLAGLPTHNGVPVPFTAPWKDGVPDFRTTDPLVVVRCIHERLCGVCGRKLGYWITFIGGPSSVENRLFSDPPMHEGCARFAVSTCPFLAGRPGLTDQTGQGRPERLALYTCRAYDLRRLRPTPDDRSAKTYFHPAPARKIEWITIQEVAR